MLGLPGAAALPSCIIVAFFGFDKSGLRHEDEEL